MPKYSVIIPVYRAEKTLRECIDSFLCQSYRDFELILVDDCSPDQSLAICQEYQRKDNRVVVYHQESNCGVSAARNRGLEIAKGEFILFADSDDFVTDSYFETLEQYAGKFDLVEFGHFDYVIKAENPSPEIRTSAMCCSIDSQKEAAWRGLFMKSFFASPCNKLFSKKLIADIRFDETCVCYEDFLFDLQYCRNIGNFVVIEEPLYYYRQIQTVNPVSKRKWGERFAISHKVADAVMSFAKLYPEEKMECYLYCYPYAAFLTELQAAKLSQGDYSEMRNKLLRDPVFDDVISAISPKGKMISLLQYSILLKIHPLAKLLLNKLVK